MEREQPMTTVENDQAALGLSKQITAWRASHGDATVDAALALAEGRRAVPSRSQAAQARAASGQSRDTASAGRSSTAPKTEA